MNTHPPSLSSQDCLVAVMIAVSASDENIRTAELMSIQAIVNHLPIFGEYDVDRIKSVAAMVLDLLSEEDGLDALFGLIRDGLPDGLNETAYAMACDVAAAEENWGKSSCVCCKRYAMSLRLTACMARPLKRVHAQGSAP